MKPQNRRVHMANERTFLAWIRTSIGLMAFGFVLERFAFFLRKLAYISESADLFHGPAKQRLPLLPAPEKTGFSAVLGLAFIAFGMATALFAFIKFKTVERQIDEGTYRPSHNINFMLAAFVLAIGALLLIYLVKSF